MSQLGEGSVCVGMEASGQLIGYFVLTLDIERASLEPELGQAIAERGSVSRQPVSQWALFAVTMILAGFRGQALHRMAIDSRLRLARERGKRGVMAMVPTTNVPSLRNLTRRGFCVDGVLDFADGRVRFLLSRRVDAEAEADWGDASREIPVNDVETHRRLIADQFAGHEVLIRGDRAYLKFSRRPRIW